MGGAGSEGGAGSDDGEPLVFTQAEVAWEASQIEDVAQRVQPKARAQFENMPADVRIVGALCGGAPPPPLPGPAR